MDQCIILSRHCLTPLGIFESLSDYGGFTVSECMKLGKKVVFLILFLALEIMECVGEGAARVG